MSSDRVRLATLLRQVQWQLDEAAFEIGAGRYIEQRTYLADVLRDLATRLDDSPEQPLVVDGTAEEVRS